jgi:hypothetical protein
MFIVWCLINLILNQRILTTILQGYPNWLHEAESLRSHSVSEEILNILLNPKIHHHVQKSTPLVPILSLMNPVHNLPPYLYKIYFNIIIL